MRRHHITDPQLLKARNFAAKQQTNCSCTLPRRRYGTLTGLKELANYYNKISCYSPINRWRNLSLHRPQPITESEAVRMYMNNLRPDMAVYLQGVRPITFEGLQILAESHEWRPKLISRDSVKE
ncbi:hypothetical protein PTKIN_Ptkin04bG0153000 [Pterospermum kingtungense]